MAGSNRIPITGRPGGSGHTTHLERSQFENGCLFFLFFLNATKALEAAQCGEGMSLVERWDANANIRVPNGTSATFRKRKP